MASENRPGWDSNFPDFERAESDDIVDQLRDFVRDPSRQQENAWSYSIPILQSEVREVLHKEPRAEDFWVLCEYELPYEARRPDVIFLLNGAVVVIELKGKRKPSSADLDQAAAYARDLRCYHRDCQDRPVHAVLVPTAAIGYRGQVDGVHIAGPDYLDSLVAELERDHTVPPLTPERFLELDAYQPLPTLVAAARHLLEHGDLPRIRRAHANTQPAIDAITRIVHEAHATGSRRLILLSGVPGAGKTLVGLRIAHASFLDDLASPRANGKKPSAPAVFLSGNGPLVEVLKFELKEAGGGGSAFVRGVKDYVKRYSKSKTSTPPEHVLIFDEAQRAWDVDQVRRKHDDSTLASEPEQFIGFAERVPDWCVVIALIGGGQEIHVGEEGGIGQWCDAVRLSARSGEWTVHGPERFRSDFLGTQFSDEASLSLDVSIRSHAAEKLHEFVAGVVEGRPPSHLAGIATFIRSQGYSLRITRDAEIARTHMRERYAGQPQARYGILVSSRSKDGRDDDIMRHERKNKWDRVPIGPWFATGREDPASCCQLGMAMSEFEVQGLELEGALVYWSRDFARTVRGEWEVLFAKKLSRPKLFKDPLQLRRNAYRVLMTRGRDSLVLCVPPLPEMDETYDYLRACGFQNIETDATA